MNLSFRTDKLRTCDSFPAPVVLMHPIVAADDNNSFTGSLAAELRGYGFDVRPFSWRQSILGRYDVLHVHWPELVTAHRTRLGVLVKSLALLVVAVKCRLIGRKVVGTVHNLAPHERVGLLRKVAILAWYRLCSNRVYLMRWARDAQHFGSGDWIPHHLYEIPNTRSVRPPAARHTPSRALLFGFLREYKGIENAIAAVRNTDKVQLTIAGKPVPHDYGNNLLDAAAGAPNIEFILQSLNFSDLVETVDAADFVLLPYKNMYSSGAALLSLQLGTPIVVVRSQSTEELSAEVGDCWVYQLDADWGAAELQEAVEHLIELRTSRLTEGPKLDQRAPSAVAEMYARSYRS